MSFICPACGYPELDIPAYRANGTPSFEICPCCGFQPGYDDDKGISFDQWRQQWIAQGMIWQSIGNKPPISWDPKKQLENLIK